MCHNQNVDIQFIQLALSIPEIKIFAISPDSALCEILPLAPAKNQVCFDLENKPEGYICDWIKPPRSLSSFKQKLKDYGVNGKNIYIKATLDFLQLCKAIFYAIKN